MAKKKANTKTKTKKQLKDLNEIGNRKENDRRTKKSPAEAKAAAPAVNRRKVKRRRQIDPTTCEREYSDCEIEFMQAMDEYKRASGRMFPTCSEILEVLSKLGYRQIAETEPAYSPASDLNDDSKESEMDFADESEEQLA